MAGRGPPSTVSDPPEAETRPLRPATIHAILDEAIVGYVGWVRDGSAVRHARQRVACGCPAPVACLCWQWHGPRNRGAAGVRDGGARRRPGPRAKCDEPLDRLPLRDGPRHGTPDRRTNERWRGARGPRREPVPGPMGPPAPDDRRRAACDRGVLDRRSTRHRRRSAPAVSRGPRRRDVAGMGRCDPGADGARRGPQAGPARHTGVPMPEIRLP